MKGKLDTYMQSFITLAIVSLAEQAGLSPTWSETLKTGILATETRKRVTAESILGQKSGPALDVLPDRRRRP